VLPLCFSSADYADLHRLRKSFNANDAKGAKKRQNVFESIPTSRLAGLAS